MHQLQRNQHLKGEFVLLNSFLDAWSCCMLTSRPTGFFLLPVYACFSRGVLGKVSYNRFQELIAAVCFVLVSLVVPAAAQTDEFGDSAADPVKLFERGQNAHAHGDFEKALEFYEQAIKVRPEFPEAEFQKGNALVSLSRYDEAE